MGTCVSKCYPSPPDSITNKPAAAAVPAKDPPLPLATAEAASPPCPTITTTSSSLSLASTSDSASSMSSSATSSAASLLLPNSNSSKSKSSREWDVVVLDPNKSDYYQHHCCSKLTSCGHHPASGSGTMPKPTKPKRARSVAPLPLTTRRSPSKLQQHKRQKPAAEREALLLRRSTEPRNKTMGAAAQDDLTNPVIAMDCFIFL